MTPSRPSAVSLETARTPDQTAAETGLTVRQVRTRLYRGDIAAVVVGKGSAKRWYIPADEVERLKAEARG